MKTLTAEDPEYAFGRLMPLHVPALASAVMNR
jgi:hypothetical protein